MLKRSKFVLGLLCLLCWVGLTASNANAQTQNVNVFWTADQGSLQVGQTGGFKLWMDGGSNPNSLCLSSFGAVFDPLGLGSVATVESFTLNSLLWSSIPTGPYSLAVAGLSATPLDGMVLLAQLQVQATALGTANLSFTQPVGDSRFVWNGSYLPTGDVNRVNCFVAPQGTGSFQVVPAPAGVGVLASCGLMVFGRRRRA